MYQGFLFDFYAINTRISFILYQLCHIGLYAKRIKSTSEDGEKNNLLECNKDFT